MKSGWIGWGLFPISGVLTGHRGTQSGDPPPPHREGRADGSDEPTRHAKPRRAGNARGQDGASGRARPCPHPRFTLLASGMAREHVSDVPSHPVCGGVSRSLGASHGALLEECPAGKAQLCGPARRGWRAVRGLGEETSHKPAMGFPTPKGPAEAERLTLHTVAGQW